MGVYLLTGNAVKCFTTKDCSGPFEVSISAKECCIGNDDSQSYQTDDMCKECVGKKHLCCLKC